MAIDKLDLGLDLERAKALPACQVCRKKSDGAVKIRSSPDVWLCGTHYDVWLNAPEYRACAEMDGLPYAFDQFVARLRKEKFARCWKE